MLTTVTGGSAMFRYCLAAVAAAAALVAGPVAAGDYVLVSINSGGSQALILDYGSIATVHDSIKQSQTLIYYEGDTVVNGVIRQRTLWLYDCAGKQGAPKAQELYTQDGAPASTVTVQDDKLSWMDIPPGSAMGDFRDYTCGLRTPPRKFFATDDDMVGRAMHKSYAKNQKGQ